MDMMANIQAWVDCQMMMIGQMCEMCATMMPG